MPLQTVGVTKLPPERFAAVLTSDALAAFEHSLARGRELLGSHTLWNVNSTAFGGGVAEMLRSLIGYVQGAGIDGRWVVVEGDAEFFRLTKRLHNRLHGVPGDVGPLGEAERNAYERRCATNAAALVEMLRPGDVVILHDPQTAGMLPAIRAATDVPLIWRAHIGLDLPNDIAREAWDFLRPYVAEADGYVFSREVFAWEGLDHGRVSIIPPSTPSPRRTTGWRSPASPRCCAPPAWPPPTTSHIGRSSSASTAASASSSAVRRCWRRQS